ncbi:hypothetical protein BDV96DRAFT_654120 [Lophiotrema nucula]|uniref:Uncharacterized protein n=1 Tax=Lophiotrema nucula TaxID=690887 RepID=A0A6A5YLI5_9PLEO|nr:hypothetical protein BDV96DRAFT_654120 [Lophiotrema nucula]
MRSVAIHPSLPILMYSTEHGLSLWGFAAMKENNETLVSTSALVDVRFSSCGNYVQGRDPLSKSRHTRIINVASCVNLLALNRTITSNKVTNANTVIPKGIQEDSAVETVSGSASEPSLATPSQSRTNQATNVITFAENALHGPSVSVLQQFHEQGTLILTTLNADGTIQKETLSRLPRHIRLSDAVLISGKHQSLGKEKSLDDEIVRLVLNVKRRSQYSLALADKVQPMPVIVEKKSRSIPKHMTTVRSPIRAIDNAYEPHARRRFSTRDEAASRAGVERHKHDISNYSYTTFW